MSRLIGIREERIILSAARLSSTPIRTIMLPAQYISMLSADASLAEALIAAHQDMHTRFPVTETSGDPQQITGYVNFKDIIACLHVSPQQPSLRSVVRRLPTLDAETSVAGCLEQLIRDYTHIALVRDAQNTVVGMVTMEDVIEELVGEIGDEYDRLPSHVIPVGNGWIVGGNAGLSQLRETTAIEFPTVGSEASPTLNQWVIHALADLRMAVTRSTWTTPASWCAKSAANPCKKSSSSATCPSACRKPIRASRGPPYGAQRIWQRGEAMPRDRKV